MTKENVAKTEKGESRALTRPRPARGLGRVRSEMDRLFDEFMGNWPAVAAPALARAARRLAIRRAGGRGTGPRRVRGQGCGRGEG